MVIVELSPPVRDTLEFVAPSLWRHKLGATWHRHSGTATSEFFKSAYMPLHFLCIADPPILSSSAENGSATAIQGRF